MNDFDQLAANAEKMLACERADLVATARAAHAEALGVWVAACIRGDPTDAEVDAMVQAMADFCKVVPYKAERQDPDVVSGAIDLSAGFHDDGRMRVGF